ncbi:hypothetical protein PVAND_006840 [Polypedilum vanderplanki]|uniref:Cytochrome-b5 reductase n=1 Tax=Polypedilum vanderplanki TaxID=319348 RepID=A0A9J6C5D2_POLVA|nr:hypothetical protein PVAND_006840 [Polypedilum vanderplanki]
MATGNPRNKVALKQGFSLVGWIRLVNSGEDLTGTNGKRFSVSLQELSKHNKQNDCWMAIRGKVYNVTRYLNYHPGGVEQLMRGAGIDATNLFDEYHSWVNIDQLLAKCYIGPLKNNFINFNLTNIDEKSSSRSLLLPPSIESVAIKKISTAVPRFDWIQKQNNLSIYFYTKSFSNPGIFIKQLCDSDKEYEITIFLEQSSHLYKFLFFKALMWPPSIKINQETGKIEISFEKVEKELWSSYGTHEKLCESKDLKDIECTIVEKQFINHDTIKLILRPKKNIIIKTSIGYHLNFRENLLGMEVIRSYTPVLPKYLNETPTFDINFLIKKYDSGLLSKYISEKNIGDTLYISHQKGSLNLTNLKSHTNIGIFAAGSGITPFSSGLIDHLLERSTNRISNLFLYYFNKKEEDIWCKNIFDEMTCKDDRFKVKYILSEANESWTGERG